MRDGSFKKSPAKSVRFQRIVAVGDIHGSYVGLVSILKETKLIDDGNRWIGGNTLLVQDGDMLDRGVDVRPVLDLLMSLQDQAETTGGKVVIVLGNHEVLNMIGSLQYVNPAVYSSFIGPGSEEIREKAFERWRAFFGVSTGPEGKDPEAVKNDWMAAHPQGFVEYIEAMGPEGRYGKWLRGLPAMFRFGATVFLHAGISPACAQLSQADINGKIAADIKEFDDDRAFLMKKKFAEPYFSISEIISVVDGILKAAEMQTLPSSVLEDLPKLKEIKSFLDGFYDKSLLMTDDGPLWFRGLAMWPDDRIDTYVPEWLKQNHAWREVVAHTPRENGRIQSRLDGKLFLIDTGMNSVVFKGGRASALVIENDDVTAVYPGGERTNFPSPEINYGPAHIWVGPDGMPLPFKSRDEIERFLMTAVPVTEKVITTGVNKPKKILLEADGHNINAIFRYQSDIENPGLLTLPNGKSRYFRDSYQSEIAAYKMNLFLGLDNMPPTVMRTLFGMKGTLQLWAEKTMSDRDRAMKNILPPEALPWNRQMWDMRVFDNLINNTDRNQTNILIDDNWRLILIDHTRSFARDLSLPNPELVEHCSRGLWHALRHLDETEVRKSLSPYLKSSEIDALFIRRQLLIRLIKDLISEKGEENVLF